ncbi:type II secretion system F family protein [Thalassotalea sp. 1_MG-2023]|uniref:type II secretion system F family protein n=1 Tax=Thalassotalea sp. 1_MG-2023 TaxID=3062680 RepID=UPI0026E30411|nr:type II secretion system F family protein [Thalassotalea sp. 1_MG-2023]MDO6426495.1 type II secretion system F family protein [Thalassotalea sp. 1_MG-2023]
MALFLYQAYDAHGAKVEGSIEAKSFELAKQELVQQKLIIVSLKEQTNSQTSTNFFESKTVSLEELEFLTSELSILLKNGVKIDKSLYILQKNKAKGASEKLLRDLYTAVKRGHMLSDAMAEHPKVFDLLYINLVRLGEASGDLSNVFEKLAIDLKFKAGLKRKIIQSLTYPLVILSVCILCILFIFNYIVPQMSGLFDGLPELPIYTQILLDVSAWMQQYQWFLFIFIVAAIIGIVMAFKNPNTKRRLDEFLLKVPLIKGALLVVERIRFNAALSMMLDAGISIDKALELSAGSVNNRFIRQGLIAAKEQIKKGEGLTASLGRSPIYPDFFLSLLEVGEESGKLSPVFNEIASRSRVEFESWTDKMTSTLEPLLILTMGGIVGSVVVTMLLSIISVNELGF